MRTWSRPGRPTSLPPPAGPRPLVGWPRGWPWAICGFALFRIFDILKPWPVSWADRKVPGGLGVMLDDVIAGVYAALALAALQQLVHAFA